MKEKLVRLTSDSFLFPGDVIGVRRGLYDHYAVYIGEDKVIQYSGDGGDFKGKVSIHVATMKDFLKMNKSYYVISFIHEVPVRIYADTNFVAGETYGLERWKADKVYSPEETVKRAMSRLGEAEYNLVFNNCEHFVMWCKTGIGWSLQVEKKVEEA
ncbi:MAG: lecithin retinol acyltransferase family protein, partial [Lachnospiraceae bacterium]|nr:lecithin retinol acyltransferase family protein [Lachnospiraceae bacterium]